MVLESHVEFRRPQVVHDGECEDPAREQPVDEETRSRLVDARGAAVGERETTTKSHNHVIIYSSNAVTYVARIIMICDL